MYGACICQGGEAGAAGDNGEAGRPGSGGSGAGGGTTGGEGGSVEPGANCIVDLVSGSYNSCALRSDQTVWCWGGGVTAPTQVAGLENVIEITSGTFHVCARKVDGTVWCWGQNSGGQIGDGTTEPRMDPVRVMLPNGFTSIFIGVAAAGFTTCARMQGGTPWCWGHNANGEVGIGTTESPQPSPVQATVVDGNEITAIIPTGGSTCVRKMDSTLWCWGDNTSGNLGDGTSDVGPKLMPVEVADLGPAVVRSTGKCAIKSDLTLWCWGLNASGQLGDGTTEDRIRPVQVSALGTDVEQVTSTFFKTCARKSDGTAWCWGRTDGGSLGDGQFGGQPCPNGDCKPNPVQVVGLDDVQLITAGIAHACAVEGDGTLWCWGADGQGQLGDGAAEGTPCTGLGTCSAEPVRSDFSCP